MLPRRHRLVSRRAFQTVALLTLTLPLAATLATAPRLPRFGEGTALELPLRALSVALAALVFVLAWALALLPLRRSSRMPTLSEELARADARSVFELYARARTELESAADSPDPARRRRRHRHRSWRAVEIASRSLERARCARRRSTSMRRLMAAIVGVLVALAADASPRPGQSVPSFTVNDLEGQAHTERDLTGGWSVAIVITDKDSGPAVHAWFDQALLGLPPSVRVVSMAALNLFPLIPTATIVGRARDDAPRHRWRSIWVSRDGSLARSLGLEEAEEPWVFVIDPEGRVVEVIHAPVDAQRVVRLRRALGLGA